MIRGQFFRYDYMFPFHFRAPLHSVILEVLCTGSTGRPVPIFRYSWGVLWQYARSRFANQPINCSRTHFQYLSTFSIPIAFSGGGAVSPETFVNS